MSWFKKWSFVEEVPMDDVYKRLYELEQRVKILEEENIETTNSIYEVANSLEARIDILASEPYNLDRFSLDK